MHKRTHAHTRAQLVAHDSPPLPPSGARGVGLGDYSLLLPQPLFPVLRGCIKRLRCLALSDAARFAATTCSTVAAGPIADTGPDRALPSPHRFIVLLPPLLLVFLFLSHVVILQIINTGKFLSRRLTCTPRAAWGL